MYKRAVFCIIAVFMIIFSGNSYAFETLNNYTVETVENSVPDSAMNFRKCAENTDFILIVDDNHAVIGLENKKTGYIWYSSPVDAENDDTASEIIRNELLSSNVLRYGIPEKRNNNNYLRSHTGDCSTDISDIANGVRITYKYSAGFEIPVDYILESDHLAVLLRVSEILETNPKNKATEVTVMGSFGAGESDEEGYFVIPDGSGALVRFNSNRTADKNAYSQPVYGSDITAVPVSAGADTEQIYMPVYGIVKQDNAMLVVASEGDSNAYITAEISGQSGSSYNLCHFSFILRNTDTFYMSGSSTDKFTVFEQGEIDSGDIKLEYYPLSGKNIDYIDIAERYRQYLIENENVIPKNDDSALYINLYGGAEKKKSVLGIPVTVRQSVTDYSQAAEILSELKSNGVDDMAVSFINWTDDGMENKIDTSAEPSGTLGGKSAFRKLLEFIDENNYSFYPSADNRDFISGNGYNSLNSTCVRISGAYSRIVSYDLAFGIPDGFKKTMSLLSPVYFDEVFSDTAESYESAGLNGISAEKLTTSLYGDYGKNKISRHDAMEFTENALNTLSGSLSIIADCANAYALPYVDRIRNIPLQSSRFDIFSEDVPFCQAVLHGLVPYSSTAVNSSPNPENALLMAVAYGCLPCYDLVYSTDEIKDTELDIYYYADYRGWTEEISEIYSLLKPLYTDIADSTIIDFRTYEDTMITEYSNGTVIKTDLSSGTIDFNGNIIKLRKE